MRLLLILIPLGLVLFAVQGIVKTGQQRLDRHGIHALAWRWLTGMPHHGKEITNAGWFRRGTPPALTRTGFAPNFYFRPRWERTAIRTGSTLTAIVTLIGYLAYPLVAMRISAFAFAGLIVYCDRRICRFWRERAHRREWIEPVHAVTAPLVNMPIAAARSWLAIEPDENHAVKKAVFDLPEGQDYSDPKWKEKFVLAASVKLGIEAPVPKWELAGPMHQLTIERSEPPPGLVTLADIWADVMAAGPDDLLFGFGKKSARAWASLVGDSPHALISMGSGAGKSGLAAFLILQELIRGAICLLLDAKWFSHPWLMDLPNVAYARSTAQLHQAMSWLGVELQRRTEVASASVDYTGRVHANVGPRLLVVAEEMNLAESRLKQYWADTRDKDDPKRSPAFTGLGDVAFAGRQVDMHLIAIGQMLSAKSVGGGEVRENMGVKCLSRYSPNAWKMNASEHAMPPPPWHPGRIQLATSAGVREVQVPRLTEMEDLKRARAAVLDGRIGVPRHDMPYVGRPDETKRPQLTSCAADQALKSSHPPEPPPMTSRLVSLREACEEQIIPVSLSNAGNYRDRYPPDGGQEPKHPKPVQRHGRTYLYDEADLTRFYEQLRSLV